MKKNVSNYFILKQTELLLKNNKYIFFLHINSFKSNDFNKILLYSKYFNLKLVKLTNKLFHKYSKLFKYYSFVKGPSYLLVTNNLNNFFLFYNYIKDLKNLYFLSLLHKNFFFNIKKVIKSIKSYKNVKLKNILAFKNIFFSTINILKAILKKLIIIIKLNVNN